MLTCVKIIFAVSNMVWRRQDTQLETRRAVIVLPSTKLNPWLWTAFCWPRPLTSQLMKPTHGTSCSSKVNSISYKHTSTYSTVFTQYTNKIMNRKNTWEMLSIYPPFRTHLISRTMSGLVVSAIHLSLNDCILKPKMLTKPFRFCPIGFE